MTRANYLLEAKQEDIYDDIKEGLFEAAKERLTRYHGALLFAWQMELITYKEWQSYQDWGFNTLDQIIEVQNKLRQEGYSTSLEK